MSIKKTIHMLSESNFKSKMDTQNATLIRISNIFKYSPYLRLSTNKINFINDFESTFDVVVSREGTGLITVESSNTDVATVSISGNIITITNISGSEGTATITVTCHSTGSHMAETKSIYVTKVLASTTLADNTWDIISLVSDEGYAKDLWNIGDELDIEIGEEIITFQIYDFDHDELKLNTGITAGITFGMKDLMTNTYQMNFTTSGTLYSSYLWDTIVNQDIYNLLPDELKNNIKSVYKSNRYYYSNNLQYNSLLEKLFLFSASEISGTNYSDGFLYPIFTDNTSRIKKLANGTGEESIYWTRSAAYSSAYGINTTGGVSNYTQTDQYGLCFGFCI